MNFHVKGLSYLVLFLASAWKTPTKLDSLEIEIQLEEPQQTELRDPTEITPPTARQV